MNDIHLWGIKQNNLKDIEVKIPIGQMTVVCGPSGSGKSSLAFETLFAEGQRRFIESLSNYARQFLNAAPKPDIEGVSNIPPALALGQKNTVKNSRSTVGTSTEIIDYLRLLFEKLGQPFCPEHQIPTSKESVTEAVTKVLKDLNGERGYLLVEVPKTGRVAHGKDLQALLIQEGFLRIMISKTGCLLGEVIEISTPASLKKGLPKETFYIVVDRLAFRDEDRGRLADSMAQAYAFSTKVNTNLLAARALVVTTENKTVIVSEDNCCPLCGYQPPPLTTKLFSFNNPYGACSTCKGFGNILELDEKKIIPNPKLSLAQGALTPFTMPSAAEDKKDLFSFCKKQKINLQTPWDSLSQSQRNLIWNGTKEFMGVRGLFAMLEEMKYKMHVRVFISRFRSPIQCPDCKGHRLRSETHFIYFRDFTLPQLTAMTVRDLNEFFSKLKLNEHETDVAKEVVHQLQSRLSFLMRVGVHYLTLARETRTLSGGEYQRLLLAHQLGMALSQTLYVLDEPTVGLHPRDNDRLITILKELRDLGNSIVVVEHDHDVIKNSDYLVEMGPGSGIYGGSVVYAGATKAFSKAKNSNTLRYLQDGRQPLLKAGIKRDSSWVILRGASGHNLKTIDLQIPLGHLVAITGVSGSGKSTAVSKTLYPVLCRALDLDYPLAEPCVGIEGVENLKNVLLLDQSPIGRSLRSNILTYMKVYDVVRQLYASTPEAKARRFTAGHFSLNVDGGRCPVCKGLGFEEVDMVFMDNVTLKCEICDGKRFTDDVLDIRYQGKTINEVLDMTVEEGLNFFLQQASLRKALGYLKEVGLEYLRLGQSGDTFSGGESQRLKIAKELSQSSHKSTLYILDEPTTGLHFREVELLLKVLRRLIEAGGSVVVVEHNLDVIGAADHVIDLGPEGGHEGGQIVFTGSPFELARQKSNLTGHYLKKHFSI